MRKNFTGRFLEDAKLYSEPILEDEYLIMDLKKGDTVTINLLDNDFYLVEYKDTLGHVEKNKLEILG